MALGKPGPLVDKIHGEIGGTVFQRSARGQFMRANVQPIRRRSRWQQDIRNVMAQAASTWGALTATIRQSWADLSTSGLSGFVIYVSAWLVQIGARSLDAPPVPQTLDHPEPLHPTTTEHDGDLILTGFSRNLLENEEAIVRTYQQVPRTWRKPGRKTIGYTNAIADEGLGVDLNIVQNIQSDPSSYAYHSGFMASSTTWTFEIWIRPDTTQAGGQEILLTLNGGTHEIMWRVDPNYFMCYDGDYHLIGACPGHGEWFYVAIVADGIAGTMNVYVNGVLYGENILWAAVNLDGGKTIGRHAVGAIRWLEGRLGPVRFSDIKRTPAEIAAIWNDGRGRMFQVDDDTRCMLRMNETTGNTLFDVYPNWMHWTRSQLTNAWGPFCQTLYPAASKIMTEGSVTMQTRVKDLTKLPGRLWRDKVDF